MIGVRGRGWISLMASFLGISDVGGQGWEWRWREEEQGWGGERTCGCVRCEVCGVLMYL
jgi:hypothetical protein